MLSTSTIGQTESFPQLVGSFGCESLTATFSRNPFSIGIGNLERMLSKNRVHRLIRMHHPVEEHHWRIPIRLA